MMSDDSSKKPRVYRVQKTRRSVWKDEEVYKVISVWKKRIFELRQTKKNKHIYAEIAEELNEMGMDTICEEVHTKIQNLSQLYRSEKRRIEQNGGPPSEWPYYQAVEDVLLSVDGPDRVLDEQIMKFNASDVVSVNDSGSCSESDIEDYDQLPPTNGNPLDRNYMTDYVANNQHSNPKTYAFAKNYISPSASVASSSQSGPTYRTERKSSTATNATAINHHHLPTIKKGNPLDTSNLYSEILNEIKRANALADLEREETNFLHKEMKELEQQRFSLTQIFVEKSLSLQQQMLMCLQANNGIRSPQPSSAQQIPSPVLGAKRKR